MAFNFTISEVASLLNLTIRHRGAHSIDVDCPFCQKRGKMNLNIDKGCFRCNAESDRSGGMLSLYAQVMGTDNSQAYREICEALNIKSNDIPRQLPTLAAKQIEYQIAPLEQRDQVYRMLFNALDLTETHKQKLISRGLSEKDIRVFGFRSTPAFGFRRLCSNLVASGYRLEGVPGFYMKDGYWLPRFSSNCTGIIVPVKAMNGMIQGMQIRLDTPVNDRKYIWFSSSEKDHGTGASSPMHFVGDPESDVIYVTEGALKADVAHSLSGKTFAAVAGVNQYTALESFLSTLEGTGKTIVEAYDMDKTSNPHVADGVAKLEELCATHKLKLQKLTWNPMYKGVDDFLFAQKKRREANHEY